MARLQLLVVEEVPLPAGAPWGHGRLRASPGRRVLRPRLLTRRKQMLTGLIPATTMVLSQMFSIEERGRDLFAAAERLDLEGIVARRNADARWRSLRQQGSIRR